VFIPAFAGMGADLWQQTWGRTPDPADHDEDVTEMNEACPASSEWVQRSVASLTALIDKPGQPTGQLRDRDRQETTMLKKISTALIVVSMLAAPAMAAGIAKTTPAPITKPVTSADNKVQAKPGVLNANAKMVRHHHRHARPHHRFHKKMSVHKVHKHTAIQTTVAHKRG
jgi:hypothetical protein